MKYIVVRYGSNAENQPGRNRAVVGVVKAASEEAAEAAARTEWHCWNNQSLELTLASNASREDRMVAREMEVLDVAEQDKELDQWATS